MPSKKKKYNARFPAGRIKKIMQSDEEIGKVAQAVPVIISRTLELFVESLLNKTVKITNSRNAKTLSTSHMKQCIMAEQRFDFLRELVKNIPDISVAEEAANYNEEEGQSSPEEAQYPDSDTPYDLSLPSTSMRASRSTTSASISITTTTTPSNGSDHYHQNGSGRAHLKRSSSVIKHHSTAEMPVAQSATMTTTITTMPNQRYQRIGYNAPRNNRNTEISYSHSAPKRSATDNPPQPHTAIPAAPIVSYDFFNKPVVKIDYSNIPVNASDSTTTPQNTTAPPHSAPADLASTRSSSSESAFNFNEAPIISIDLSNIVADSGHTSCNAGNRAVATISIGAIPPVVSATIDKTTTPTTTHPVSTIPTTNSNPDGFTKTTMNTMKNSATTLNAAAVKSSFFELDEDYDNI